MRKGLLFLSACAVFLTALIGLPGAATAQELRVRFTNPLCREYVYPAPLPTQSGQLVKAKPKDIFCTRADLPFNLARPDGIYAEITRVLQEPGVARVTFATMTYSHRELTAQLCVLEKRGVQVRLILDGGADKKSAEELIKCGVEVTPVQWNGHLHHNKFILVDYLPQTGRASSLVFSSANFSNPGLTINHEMWGFYRPLQPSLVVEQHRCLAEGLIALPTGGQPLAKAFNECRTRAARQIQRPEPLQFFAIPFDSKKLVDILTSQLRSSKIAKMTSNRFSFPAILAAVSLRPAGSPALQAVFDDDLFWMGVRPEPALDIEARQEAGGGAFGSDPRRIRELEALGAQVRFAETSAGAAQKMHSKYTIFDRLVVGGSGNYTASGMTQNFENIYVFNDPFVHQSFLRHFEALWKGSTQRGMMPKANIEPK
ncbi:MAG: phospholipase D family protein [Bdellovibrionaceae bacterium]|nr:phospholipase D family protein [Pseudobdellovibrionaceae bacterium]